MLMRSMTRWKLNVVLTEYNVDEKNDKVEIKNSWAPIRHEPTM